MQKLKAIVIAAVMVFGIGGAVVANQLADPQANVMNIAPEGQPEQWVPITPGHKGCDDDSQRACTGYQESSTSTPLVLAFGNPLP